MGVDLNIALPADEGAAISIIGESFPPIHAFEALLLALTLHPARQLTQSQVDDFFSIALSSLAPKDPHWDMLTQVQYQGWAKLCVKGQEEREQSNLARRVHLSWQQNAPGSLAFLEQHGLLFSQAPSKEVSYFSMEVPCDAEMHCSLRPGWPPRWIPLGQDDELEQWHVLQYVAEVWGTDPWITLAVHANDVYKPRVILVDEVQQSTVTKRLVLCDTAPPRATWSLAFPSKDQLLNLTLQGEVDVAINGHLLCTPSACIHDGDVLRAIPESWPSQAREPVCVSTTKADAVHSDNGLDMSRKRKLAEQEDPLLQPTVLDRSDEECAGQGAEAMQTGHGSLMPSESGPEVKLSGVRCQEHLRTPGHAPQDNCTDQQALPAQPVGHTQSPEQQHSPSTAPQTHSLPPPLETPWSDSCTAMPMEGHPRVPVPSAGHQEPTCAPAGHFTLALHGMCTVQPTQFAQPVGNVQWPEQQQLPPSTSEASPAGSFAAPQSLGHVPPKGNSSHEIGHALDVPHHTLPCSPE